MADTGSGLSAAHVGTVLAPAYRVDQCGAPKCHQPHLAQYVGPGSFSGSVTVSHLPVIGAVGVVLLDDDLTSLFVFIVTPLGGGGEWFIARCT